MSKYSSGFDSLDSRLANRVTSEQRKQEKTILALMFLNGGSKRHLDAFSVNERP
jgi:hypothetical protein